MKTVVEKVYHCEFCRKYSRSAGWISRHEKHCQARSENKHKCFDTCRFLKRTLKLIDNRDPENRYSYKTIFTCIKLNQQMYSYLLEKRINFKPEFILGLTKMPVVCTAHEYMTEKEIEQRFNPSQND